MKKYIYLMLTVVLAGIFASCSKDDPFDNRDNGATGRLLTTALDVSLTTDGGPRSLKDRRVRAAAPNVDDFTVAFYREGSETAEATYTYKDMPEIVTLPVGRYEARASYGANADAAWDAPYYEGSSSFEIKADQITDEVAPIVCKFANIRVSVKFDKTLRESMGAGCKVTVKAGDFGTLDFTTDDEDAGRSGYFRYVGGSNTLAATFSGPVDGVYSTQMKAFDNVQPGTHYTITFRLYDAGEEDPGFIVTPGDSGLISVSAQVEDENKDIDIDFDDPSETDDLRPSEGEAPKPDDPQPPVEGNPPAFHTNDGVSMDGRNHMVDGMQVELTVTSETGFEEFTVKIISDILAPEVDNLLGTTVLTLVDTPETYKDFLESQGFPTNVQGQKKAEISLTKFIPMILLLAGERHGDYSFEFTVKDANGTTVKTLTLYN